VGAHRVVRRGGFQIYYTIYGGEVVIRTHRQPFLPGRLAVPILLETGRIRSIEESNDFIEDRTHGLPTYIILPQPITLSLVWKA
jgi:hypothetical protein